MTGFLNLPALLFEPDGYVLDGPKLMGRQAAGNAFLRAAINVADQHAAAGQPSQLYAYTPNQQSATTFAELVKRQAPSVEPKWIPADRADLLAQKRALFLPGPGLGEAARFRLRANPAAWSITGATYTLCSHTAMDAIVDILQAPVMPWDALICATTVAKHAVNTLFELQAQYLAWRFGVRNFVIPQMPVIPFGIHTDDFDFSDRDKETARSGFGIQPKEVAILFAGRLSFHAKAHPYPMFLALEKAAQTTGERLHLLLCGQFPNDAVKEAFLAGAKSHCPSVRVQWINGKSFDAYSQAWAASDLFVSLSDNLQETFGITPVEAMASGLPVIVSDWDGYKDTVIDGETGYRIRTWMPPPDLGMALASAFEAGTINYDRYIGLACLDVVIDITELTQRLCELITSPAKRQAMGQAGRKRARAVYDWQIVMRQHLDLWGQLEQIRAKAQTDHHALLKDAPNCAPARQDPYRVFGSFPTHALSGLTKVTINQAADLSPETWASLRSDRLLNYAGNYLPPQSMFDAIIGALKQQTQPIGLDQLAPLLSLSLGQTIKTVAVLAKLGFVCLQQP